MRGVPASISEHSSICVVYFQRYDVVLWWRISFSADINTHATTPRGCGSGIMCTFAATLPANSIDANPPITTSAPCFADGACGAFDHIRAEYRTAAVECTTYYVYVHIQRSRSRMCDGACNAYKVSVSIVCIHTMYVCTLSKHCVHTIANMTSGSTRAIRATLDHQKSAESTKACMISA